MKLLKWPTIIIASILVLISTGVIYLTQVLNPNDLKPQLIEQVKQQTGRELRLEGQLAWQFFPVFGIQINQVSLSNPQGFASETMLSIERLLAQVEVMPLFEKQLRISALTVSDFTLNLITNAQGQHNLEGSPPSTTEKTSTPENMPAAVFSLQDIKIDNILLENAIINLIDQRTTQHANQLHIERLTVKDFALDTPTPLEVIFHTQLAQLTATAGLTGEFELARDFSTLAFTALKLEAEASGFAGVPPFTLNLDSTLSINLRAQQLAWQLMQLQLSRSESSPITAQGKLQLNYGHTIPTVELAMTLGAINIDDWLPPQAASQTPTPAQQSMLTQQQATEPDLSAFRSLNAKITLDIEAIRYQKLRTEHWQIRSNLDNGLLRLNQLSASLYQGQLQLNAELDTRQTPAHYRFEQQLTDVQIQPLLQDAIELNFLAGRAQLSLSGTGHGLAQQQLLHNLVAKGEFSMADGALYGVNIPQLLRDTKAKLKGTITLTLVK